MQRDECRIGVAKVCSLRAGYIAGVMYLIVVAFSLHHARAHAEEMVTPQALMQLIHIDDVQNVRGATSGYVVNDSNRWLHQVHLVVRYHQLLGETPRRIEPEQSVADHADIVLDQPIPPFSKTRFSYKPNGFDPGQSNDIVTKVSLVSVQPYEMSGQDRPRS